MLINAGAATNIYDNEGNTAKDVLPDMMWENRKELVTKLDIKEEESKGIKATQSKALIIKSKRGTVETVTTIDLEHKSIYEENIDTKSSIKNSDIGIVID